MLSLRPWPAVFLYLPIAVTAANFGYVRRDTLPVVDLGYELHQAIEYSESGGFYNFSNIRYAQPPIGDLRFRAPLAPEGNSSDINNGSVGRTCPQASGAWTVIAKLYATDYALGKTFNYTAALTSLPGPAVPGSDQYDGRTTEDCLFLDVYAPTGVFDSDLENLPVLIWLFGGGYTAGEKNGDGGFDPTSLFEATSTPYIFVAPNYRLGAFGWLAGSTLQSDGTANAGLYDQDLAFKWVQQYIHLFGGNSSRVTVMGKSAGSGSLMHQITAYGGATGEEPPFQQAIVTSPAFLPIPTSDVPESVFQEFLTLLNVTSLAEARQLPTEQLIYANAVQIYNSTYGSNSFGPVVDGSFVPKLPGQLLAEGSFYKNIAVMVSHNSNEALLFTDPRINSSLNYDDFLAKEFPHISNDSAQYVEDVLYPPVFDGTYGYVNGFQRAAKTVSDSAFTCNTYYLNTAFDNATHAWEFSVYPGIHGQDTAYIFPASEGSSLLAVNQTIATLLRDYVANFVVSGSPGSGFPTYGAENQIMNLTSTGIGLVKDEASNERCIWWQKADYY